MGKMQFFFKSATVQTLAKTFFNLGTFFVHIIFFAFLGLQALFYISILFWSPAVSSSWGISVLICFELTETNHILSLSRSYLDHVIICSMLRRLLRTVKPSKYFNTCPVKVFEEGDCFRWGQCDCFADAVSGTVLVESVWPSSHSRGVTSDYLNRVLTAK